MKRSRHSTVTPPFGAGHASSQVEPAPALLPPPPVELAPPCEPEPPEVPCEPPLPVSAPASAPLSVAAGPLGSLESWGRLSQPPALQPRVRTPAHSTLQDLSTTPAA